MVCATWVNRCVRRPNGWVALRVLPLFLVLCRPGFAQTTPDEVNEPSDHEGMVLRIDDLGPGSYELVVDIGRDLGVVEGTELHLFARTRVEHPVTGQVIEDLVPLGAETVIRSGRYLSVIQLETSRRDLYRVGDVVTTGQTPGNGVMQTAGPTAAAECMPCESDLQALEVHLIWLASIGRSLDERADAWRSYLAIVPDTPFASQIEREIAFLEAAGQDRAVLQRERLKEKSVSKRPRASHRPLAEIPQSMPLSPVLTLSSEAGIQAVTLFYRRQGEKYYAPLPMLPIGDLSHRARIPEEALLPGRIEYFIEAVDGSGARIAAFRSAESPHTVRIVPPPVFDSPTEGRSSASLDFEWVDFYLDNPGQDQMWVVEGDLKYRLEHGVFYSLAMGFGIFEGRGGPAELIELGDLDPVKLAVNYVYFEPEISLGDYLHIIPRFLVGGIQEKKEIGDPTIRRSGGVFGFHGYLRIGKERGTNLLVGASVSQEMGNEGIIAMNLDVLENFPIGVSAVATNFPVAEDYAARLLFQIGWEQFDGLSLTAQFGVNMRNIHHLGLSGGLGLVFNW